MEREMKVEIMEQAIRKLFFHIERINRILHVDLPVTHTELYFRSIRRQK